mgnify:CR=1 FL=1
MDPGGTKADEIALAIEEAIVCARELQSEGLLLTLDYLGESVRTLEEADAATREYIRLMEVIVAARAVQGLGAGAMLALAYVLIGRPERAGVNS